MKTKSLLLVVVILMGWTGLNAQEGMYEKFSQDKNITTVYITKSMLSMVPEASFSGMDMKVFMDKLDQMEVYTSDNETSVKLMKDEMKKITSGNLLEVLMAIKEDDTNISFHGQKEGDKFKEMIMFVDQPDECVLMRMKGSFTVEDMQGIMNNMNINK